MLGLDGWAAGRRVRRAGQLLAVKITARLDGFSKFLTCSVTPYLGISNRNTQRISDFLIGQAPEVAEDKNSLMLWCKLSNLSA